jgi:hypothetical protein
VRLVDPKDDQYYEADTDAAGLDKLLEDRDCYTMANVFWVPEAARWESIRAAAKQRIEITFMGCRIACHLDPALRPSRRLRRKFTKGRG